MRLRRTGGSPSQSPQSCSLSCSCSIFEGKQAKKGKKTRTRTSTIEPPRGDGRSAYREPGMSPFPFVRFWSLGAFFFGIVLAILTIFTSCVSLLHTVGLSMLRQILFRAPVKKVRDSNGISMEAPEMKFVFALLDKTKAREDTLGPSANSS